LNTQLFNTQNGCIGSKCTFKNKSDNGVEAIKEMQRRNFIKFISWRQNGSYAETSSMNKVTILLMNWLMILRMVFSELNGSTSIDVFRRNIQKRYVIK
jgi:hypothetical protein